MSCTYLDDAAYVLQTFFLNWIYGFYHGNILGIGKKESISIVI